MKTLCNCAEVGVLDAVVGLMLLRSVLSFHTAAVDDRAHYSANRQVMHL